MGWLAQLGKESKQVRPPRAAQCSSPLRPRTRINHSRANLDALWPY